MYSATATEFECGYKDAKMLATDHMKGSFNVLGIIVLYVHAVGKERKVESHYMRSPSKMGLASSDLHQLTPSLPGYSNLSMLSGFISTL